jgi:signal transduction histidine kinase
MATPIEPPAGSLQEKLATLDNMQRATLNILEDFDSEKQRLEEVQRASLNILEDLDAEKNKVEQTNREMAREIAERKQAEERLAAQYAVTRVLAEAASLGEATPELLRAVCETLGWQLGERWEVDRRANGLRCVGTWHAPALSVGGDFEAVTRETSFAPGVGLLGRVWSTAKPIWIPNVLKDPTFVRAVDAAKGGLHAAFGFPILIAGKVAGVVDFLSREIRPQDNDVMQMMSALGSQIGQFIERKRAEEEIRTSNQQLEVANKELEAFSYSVSHDLRAPLRSIDGFSQALLEDYAEKLDEEGKDYLLRVRASTQRMGELIDDMLNLSRVTRREMRRERVDLSAMAHALAAKLQQSAPDRQVDFVIADGLSAEGDARLLRIVMDNLLGNAWKYASKHPRARIEFGFAQNNGQSAYFVRDDGAGFDMAYADKLFGAFQRLHRQTEFSGTGIGLATVQRIMHRHGGRVWAEGEVEKGATFYFTLSS